MQKPPRPGSLDIRTPIHTIGVAPDHMTPAPLTSNDNRAGPIGHGLSAFNQNLLTVQRTTKSLEQEYQTKSGQLPQSIESELASVRTEGPTDPLPPSQSIIRELGVLNTLTQRKAAELQSKTATANAFFGGDPFNRNINDFMIKATKMEPRPGPNGIAMQAWVQSLRAGHDARLLSQTIQSLNQRTSDVQNFLRVAQANEEAQRAAAELARINEEAAARAREQARLAALENARRVAEEQARIAAQAAAQQVAAEQETKRAAAEEARNAQIKRAAEEDEQKRAEQDARLKYLASWHEALKTDRANSPFLVSGSAASVVPVFTVAAGSIFTPANKVLSIKSALRAAVAAVIAASSTSAGVAIGGFAALLFPSPLGNSELNALSVPLSDLTPNDLGDLYAIAVVNGEIDLPVSIGSRTVDDSIEFIVASTNGTSVPSKVTVRLAILDPGLNVYRSYSADTPSISMTWTPIVKPKDASTTLPLPESRIYIYNGTTPTALGGRVDEFPELDLYSFGGFINVFPAESGIPPIYTMFRDRRDDPGVASGYGEAVLGIWLGSASQDNGAVIPNKIADKLRGQNFSSFRAFRETLWRAVIDDPDLAEQFTANNIQEMKNGRAPFSRKSDRVGVK